jgi:hypothetical protein
MRILNCIALFVATLLVWNSQVSIAYDGDRAISNLASDFSECAAYYTIAAEGLRRSGRADVAATSEAASDSARQAATKISRADVALARYKLALEDQIKSINGDYANLAILIEKYGSLCKQILEDPLSRLRYWLEKK